MKKILLLLFTIFIMYSCIDRSVYHTYYGDINIDTLTAYCEDGSVYYIVNTKLADSSQANAMGLDSMLWVIYYKPVDNTYFLELRGSDGGSSPKIEFNPLEDEF